MSPEDPDPSADPPSPGKRDSYDSPWKEILDRYFEEFMAFFFPKAHADVDWSRGYESLDKELQKVIRQADSGRMTCDKLMKVWRRSGEEQIVLIHIEIQGDRESGFALRMFCYYYRLFDRYKKPVVSLAILTDDDPEWLPGRHHEKVWDCEVSFRFPVVKLWDYNEKWSELEASDNPFATVAMTQLRTRGTRHDPEGRLRWKIRLVRRLYERDYQRKDVVELFRFIDWLMALPAELEDRFEDQLHQFETESNMPYITTIERRSMAKGQKQGRKQGKIELLKRLLTRRYGALPDWVLERLDQSGEGELEQWSERVLEAQSLAEVFAL